MVTRPRVQTHKKKEQDFTDESNTSDKMATGQVVQMGQHLTGASETQNPEQMVRVKQEQNLQHVEAENHAVDGM